MTAAAYVFTALVVLLALFQLALMFGMPWGRFAWGGRHAGVLPIGYRVGSGISILVHAFFATVVLGRAGFIGIYPDGFTRVAIWVVVGVLVLGVLMNAISRSRPERLVMTPVALVLAVLALIVALYGPVEREFAGMVLDNGQGGGPVFCTAVMESFPPQCGDPVPVDGWSWGGLEHWDEQGQRWGDYRFDGVLEGGRVTPTGEIQPLR
jgi:hypothetical protein